MQNPKLNEIDCIYALEKLNLFHEQGSSINQATADYLMENGFLNQVNIQVNSISNLLKRCEKANLGNDISKDTDLNCKNSWLTKSYTMTTIGNQMYERLSKKYTNLTIPIDKNPIAKSLESYTD